MEWLDNLFNSISNKNALLILMVVLVIFVVLLTVLGIVFIIALRKRRPVVKVVMAPLAQQSIVEEAKAEAQAQAATLANTESVQSEVISAPIVEAVQPVEEPEPEEEDDDDDDETPQYVTEGHEQVRYNRSFAAKLCQLSNEAKEWYSILKNDLLSYERVKARQSWKRETFRVGRITIARLVIRGKTLCLLLAVEPISYTGTKYSVEDVSNMANTMDTPTLYRVKSTRRLKYAKDMIAGMMKELKSYKDPRYEAKDYFLPYEGDMALMQRGLVKRVVSGSTRTYKIEEVDTATKNAEEDAN